MNNLENVSEVLESAADLSVEEIDALIVALVLQRSKSNGAKQEIPEDKGDRLLTVEEASEKLGCSMAKLYKHPKEYRSFEVKSGGTLRFSEKGIERYITRNVGRD